MADAVRLEQYGQPPVVVALSSSAPVAVALPSPEASVMVTPVGFPGPQGPTGPQGPAGPQGPVGAPATYTHNQAMPSATWTIVHNLGFRPAVDAYDTADQECEGDIAHPDLDTTVLTFSAAFAGWARLY